MARLARRQVVLFLDARLRPLLEFQAGKEFVILELKAHGGGQEETFALVGDGDGQVAVGLAEGELQIAVGRKYGNLIRGRA